jgi:EpsI family protein
MAATMRKWPGMVAPVLLAAQLLLVDFARGRQPLPAPPDLARLPRQFQDWSELREDPLDQEIVAALHADRLLSRIYVDHATGALASLFLAWFQSQSGGDRQPHSPKVCLPASGWVPEASGEVEVRTAADAFPVNRYVVANGSERAVVLYWYQTPRGPLASEWASKLDVLADALRNDRTDTSLVRVVVWSAAGGDQQATSTAVRFAGSLYPLLLRQLPR